MAFRLWTIFYVFAVVAAAMAVFGGWGIAVAAFVLAFWGWVFYGPKLPFTPLEFLIVVAIIGFLLLLLEPATQSARGHTRRAGCTSNLKWIAMALLDYESEHGSLPPTYITDSMGAPINSWRALILPRIEFQSLYDKLDLSQPWNSAANRAATSADVEIYDCVSDIHQNSTTHDASYFAVVGNHTAWPGGSGRKLKDISDPKSQTILLVEAVNRDVPWAAPSDLTFDEAVQLLTDPDLADAAHWYDQNSFFYKGFNKRRQGINVAMADGRVVFLTLPLPKELAIALLTIDGGEGDVQGELDYYSSPQLDYAKCYALGVFVILALLPIGWLRRHPSSVSREN